MPLRTLLTPSNWIASVPAAAMPAPTIEKTSAWLELEGMPYHQVIRFQVIAESSDAADQLLRGQLGRNDALADGRRDGGAGQRADDIEDRRHQHGLARAQHPGGHRGRDGVGGVVEAVDEVEAETERDDDDQDDQLAC